MVVMLNLAGSARADYTPYFWGNTSGDWASPGTWANHWEPVPPGHHIPSPEARYDGNGVPIQGYEDIAITIGGVTINVTTDGQGCVQLYQGYHVGVTTLNIAAGKHLQVTMTAQVGLGNDASPEIATGILNVYGSFYCKKLFVPNSKTDTGIINIYAGGSVDVNEWGCDVGFADANAFDATGTVNFKGGIMTIQGALVINLKGLINIEAGTLKVFGDVRTQLQGYVDNGRITSFGGVSPLCFPVVSFLDGYTYVKTRTCVTYLPADLNQDCYVDTLDFAMMAAHWLDCTEPTDSNCVQ